MPKKVAKDEKKAWAKEFEEGAMVVQLGLKYKRDPRTVHRGIEDVRREQLAKEAQVDLLRSGLRRHQDDLLATLDQIVSSVSPLPVLLGLPDPNVPPPTLLEVGRWVAMLSADRYAEIQLDVEEGFLWQLLGEHIGKDRAFRLLDRWKGAVIKEINARLTLRETMVDRVIQNMGLTIQSDISHPGTVRGSALEQLFRAAVSRILGQDPPDILTVESALEGEFFVNRASGGRLPAKQEGLLVGLANLPTILAGDPEGLALSEASAQVEGLRQEAKEFFQEIRATHYLAGTCRSCRRYDG